MAHKTIRLTTELPGDYIDELISKGVQLDDTDYEPALLITDYCTVLKPNGEVLLKFLPRSIPLDYATTAFHEFEDADLHDSKDSARRAIANSVNPGSEAVLGFMDPVHRLNFCRATSFTAQHMKEFEASLPFIRATAELMKEHAPDKYAAQLAACLSCRPDYIIPGTPFSTVTLNRDTTATCHTDKGDYKPGMGVIAATWAKRVGTAWRVVGENPVAGGILVFPKYRAAVMLRSCDVVLCDVHEAHGVTQITETVGTWARMSFVFYLRERMHTCESPVEEFAKVSRKDTAKYMDEES